MAKSKKGLIIGVSLLVGTGIAILVWHLHTKKKARLAEAAAKAALPPVTDQTQKNPDNTSPVVDTTIGSSTNPVAVQSGAPKNTLAFQQWCNKNKGTSLEEDGDFGKFSKAAWASFGLEYQKIENMKTQSFTAFKGNPLGYTVSSKYVGSDIFDGNTADNVFTKLGVTPKVQAMGKVAKVVSTNQGAFVTFKSAGGKFFKMHSAHLNIFA